MMILRRYVLAAALAATVVYGQDPKSDIRKAEDAWVGAISKADAGAADRILADDLIYTHATGYIDSKAQYLGKLKSAEQKYTSVKYLDQKIRVYGDTAVVNGTLRMIGATKGVPFDNTNYVTHVWTKTGNGWKLVSHQTTKKAS